jgi:hypothetical protein
MENVCLHTTTLSWQVLVTTTSKILVRHVCEYNEKYGFI